jgi:hypothetical protein
MKLTDDLTSARAIFWKGWIFFACGLFAASALVLLNPAWQNVLLLAIAVWSFCRWYYFMFYVVEKYVVPSFRFDGLFSFLRYMRSRS